MVRYWTVYRLTLDLHLELDLDLNLDFNLDLAQDPDLDLHPDLDLDLDLNRHLDLDIRTNLDLDPISWDLCVELGLSLSSGPNLDPIPQSKPWHDLILSPNLDLDLDQT